MVSDAYAEIHCQGWTTHTMALQARRTASSVDGHVSILKDLLINSIKLCIHIEEP